jgi:hypothetical protein
VTPERWRQIEALYHAARERGSGVLADADADCGVKWKGCWRRIHEIRKRRF